MYLLNICIYHAEVCEEDDSWHSLGGSNSAPVLWLGLPLLTIRNRALLMQPACMGGFCPPYPPRITRGSAPQNSLGTRDRDVRWYP